MILPLLFALASVQINGTPTVQVGDTVALAAVCKQDDGSTGLCESPIWSSTDLTIAQVNRDGIVTGIKAGNVMIRATEGTTQATFITGNLPFAVTPVGVNGRK